MEGGEDPVALLGTGAWRGNVHGWGVAMEGRVVAPNLGDVQRGHQARRDMGFAVKAVALHHLIAFAIMAES